jgi:hypothetical protein
VSQVSERRLKPDQKFAEPVALSSTQPADRPLPRRAFRLSLNLVALRARRVDDANPSRGFNHVPACAVAFGVVVNALALKCLRPRGG